MIPPSITLILYANVTGASIADLFIATVIPGLIMMTMYILAAYTYIFKRGYDKTASVAVTGAVERLQEKTDKQDLPKLSFGQSVSRRGLGATYASYRSWQYLQRMVYSY